MLTEKIREALAEVDPDIILYDGLEEAFAGISRRFGREPIAIYDYDKCIDIYMKRDGMTYEEASEFFEYNTIGGWNGDHTPCFLKSVSAIAEEL